MPRVANGIRGNPNLARALSLEIFKVKVRMAGETPILAAASFDGHPRSSLASDPVRWVFPFRYVLRFVAYKIHPPLPPALAFYFNPLPFQFPPQKHLSHPPRFLIPARRPSLSPIPRRAIFLVSPPTHRLSWHPSPSLSLVPLALEGHTHCHPPSRCRVVLLQPPLISSPRPSHVSGSATRRNRRLHSSSIRAKSFWRQSSQAPPKNLLPSMESEAPAPPPPIPGHSCRAASVSAILALVLQHPQQVDRLLILLSHVGHWA